MTTATYSEIEIELPPLHPSQRRIANDPSRFKVVCCGRRWGKTLLAVGGFLLPAALQSKRVWHVAPTYKQTLEAWDYLMRLVSQLPPRMVNVSISELKISFVGGGSIQMRTGDNPNNLRGSGLDGVVIDEAATAKPEIWDLVLRPALADKQGWALFISTPNHYNWFYDLFQRGEEGQQDWASWQRPTWDNPHIAESEIEAARRDMDEADFEQEFGASFTAVGGAVFPLLSSDRHIYLRPLPDGLVWSRVGVGLDWGTTAQHNASVVCMAMTTSGVVWVRSAWLDASGDDGLWFNEAERCVTDYGASFARVDRSQSSAIGNLKALKLLAETGVADVEARVGAYQGMIRPRRIFFDIGGPGVREYFTHLAEYHRDPNTGKPVEEHDDDVDAGGYVLHALVQPHKDVPSRWRISDRAERPAMRLGRLN